MVKTKNTDLNYSITILEKLKNILAQASALFPLQFQTLLRENMGNKKVCQQFCPRLKLAQAFQNSVKQTHKRCIKPCVRRLEQLLIESAFSNRCIRRFNRCIIRSLSIESAPINSWHLFQQWTKAILLDTGSPMYILLKIGFSRDKVAVWRYEIVEVHNKKPTKGTYIFLTNFCKIVF